MLPRRLIDEFITPDGNRLQLVSRGRDWFIDLDGEELMSTRRTGSEEALARLGIPEGPAGQAPGGGRQRVLIGGLGLCFTLQAARQQVGAGGRIVVAELFEQVLRWNEQHLAERNGPALRDKRVRVALHDVWDEVGRGPWTSILLDTDNGPDAFCLERNQRLYRSRGLDRLRDALVPGGTLAIWSAEPCRPQVIKAMTRAGFQARGETVRERGNKGTRYGIYIGVAPASRQASGERAAAPQRRARGRRR